MNDIKFVEVVTLISELSSRIDSASMHIRLCSQSNDPDGEFYQRGKRQALFDFIDYLYEIIGEGDS